MWAYPNFSSFILPSLPNTDVCRLFSCFLRLRGSIWIQIDDRRLGSRNFNPFCFLRYLICLGRIIRISVWIYPAVRIPKSVNFRFVSQSIQVNLKPDFGIWIMSGPLSSPFMCSRIDWLIFARYSFDSIDRFFFQLSFFIFSVCALPFVGRNIPFIIEHF